MKRHHRMFLAPCIFFVMNGGGTVAAVEAVDQEAASPQLSTQPQAQNVFPEGGEQTISEATLNHLPGNRMVTGRIKDIRGDQMEIDIGNLQPLYIPLKPAKLKGQIFKPDDPIIVTLNDHNAIVDYHHPNEAFEHRIIRGRLITPLTVGLDKAVIDTEQGVKTFMVAERAKGKLTAMPVGAEILFMTDETGHLVDAQLASAQAVQESAANNKARVKGAHNQVEAVFQGAEQPSASGPAGGEGRLKILEKGQEREVPFRPPLKKLDRLQAGQDVVLLMDDQGYVLEIATPEISPSR
jgi:hypothetical protein